ncbi:MAG: ParB N-terminal domain-containing protein [Proteobacteria bacterium]|nr:ParB N-terminal domain-containing protein [Pseudomonadota bacterium]
MDDLKVEYRDLKALKPYDRNARTHSKKQIRQIAASIERFGWTNPVLIDGQDQIVAGHGRVAAAKRLGIEAVPTIRLETMSEVEIRAYVIADNRLAELAEWDDEILAIELQALVELDFDVEVTGFETAEIDLLIDGLDAAGAIDDGDRIPEVDPSASRVTQAGDLWRLGRHRLLCGDATKRKSFERLMAGERAQMVFTDPPYNVPIDGHVCGLGRIRHAEFAMAWAIESASMPAGTEGKFLFGRLQIEEGGVSALLHGWVWFGGVIREYRALYAMPGPDISPPLRRLTELQASTINAVADALTAADERIVTREAAPLVVH